MNGDDWLVANSYHYGPSYSGACYQRQLLPSRACLIVINIQLTIKLLTAATIPLISVLTAPTFTHVGRAH